MDEGQVPADGYDRAPGQGDYARGNLVNGGRDGVPGGGDFLHARQFEQMVVSGAFFRIGKDVVGAHDFSEAQRRFGIARSEVRVSTFDGSAERGPESFG